MTAFLKKYKFYIIAAAVAVVVLIIAFVSGGSVSPQQIPAPAKATADSAETTVVPQSSDAAVAVTEAATENTSTEPSTAKLVETSASAAVASTGAEPTQAQTENDTKEEPHTQPAETRTEAAETHKTDPVPAQKPAPVEPQEQTSEDKKSVCTFSISCTAILNHKDEIDDAVLELVPDDGWLLKPVTVEIAEGESVFEVTKRICRDNGIHFEFSFNPAFNSAYIEGIGNIYEFDCGDSSGWLYQVNDWFPNYGCSRYVLHDGDTVSWHYSCVNGDFAAID